MKRSFFRSASVVHDSGPFSPCSTILHYCILYYCSIFYPICFPNPALYILQSYPNAIVPSRIVLFSVFIVYLPRPH